MKLLTLSFTTVILHVSSATSVSNDDFRDLAVRIFSGEAPCTDLELFSKSQLEQVAELLDIFAIWPFWMEDESCHKPLIYAASSLLTPHHVNIIFTTPSLHEPAFSDWLVPHIRNWQEYPLDELSDYPLSDFDIWSFNPVVLSKFLLQRQMEGRKDFKILSTPSSTKDLFFHLTNPRTMDTKYLNWTLIDSNVILYACQIGDLYLIHALVNFFIILEPSLMDTEQYFAFYLRLDYFYYTVEYLKDSIFESDEILQQLTDFKSKVEEGLEFPENFQEFKRLCLQYFEPYVQVALEEEFMYIYTLPDTEIKDMETINALIENTFKIFLETDEYDAVRMISIAEFIADQSHDLSFGLLSHPSQAFLVHLLLYAKLADKGEKDEDGNDIVLLQIEDIMEITLDYKSRDEFITNFIAIMKESIQTGKPRFSLPVWFRVLADFVKVGIICLVDVQVLMDSILNAINQLNLQTVRYLCSQLKGIPSNLLRETQIGKYNFVIGESEDMIIPAMKPIPDTPYQEYDLRIEAFPLDTNWFVECTVYDDNEVCEAEIVEKCRPFWQFLQEEDDLYTLFDVDPLPISLLYISALLSALLPVEGLRVSAKYILMASLCEPRNYYQLLEIFKHYLPIFKEASNEDGSDVLLRILKSLIGDQTNMITQVWTILIFIETGIVNPTHLLTVLSTLSQENGVFPINNDDIKLLFAAIKKHSSQKDFFISVQTYYDCLEDLQDF